MASIVPLRSDRNRWRWAGVRLPIVPPKKAISRRPPSGDLGEVAVEVADDGVDVEAVVVVGQPGRGGPEELVAHVERQVAPQRSVDGHGVEQQAGLVAGPGPQLDQGVGQGQPGDGRGVGLEQRPLGPGRVVLGQPGDVLEQPAAGFVVEPDRREALAATAGGHPVPDVVLQRDPQILGTEVDVDGERRTGHG